MLWLRDELADHGLNDADIAVEKTAYGSPEHGNPNIGGKSYHDHAKHGSNAAEKQDGLAANAVREAAPVHAHGSLGKREGRDEETGVERGILFVSKFKPLDESPGVGENGRKSDRLCQANNSWEIKLALPGH